MKINELTHDAYETALEKGWWDDDRTYPESVMMIITEVSESVQKDRSGDVTGRNEEIADVYIRLGDLCGHLGIDIEKEIIRKMEINKKRPYRHNKKY